MFEWSSKPTAEVGVTLKFIMKSDLYAQYETGQIETEQQFCQTLGRQLDINGTHIETTFRNARKSLQPNQQLVDCIRDLKRVTSVAVYAMSNISRGDLEYVQREHSPAMEIFDGVFASGVEGVRKPDPEFYRTVIEKTKLVPERTIFVDDKSENVDAACRFGLFGLRFDGTDALCELLRSLILAEEK